MEYLTTGVLYAWSAKGKSERLANPAEIRGADISGLKDDATFLGDQLGFVASVYVLHSISPTSKGFPTSAPARRRIHIFPT
jgi:hypothetical protein